MKVWKILGHAALVAAALFLLAGLPILTHFSFSGAGQDADAATGASIELPDQPSGDFMVLVNRTLHPDTIDDWRDFFNDEEFVVIFEDVECLVSEGDVTGQQLAERFQAQLPENQMQLRAENATLLASKAEAGRIDIAVFSEEMAEALELSVSDKDENIAVIRVSGGEE